MSEANHEGEEIKKQSCARDWEKLKNEYEQLCQDWRLRDSYVIEKFFPASVLFASVVLGYSQIGCPLIRTIILGFGCAFSFAIAISAIKDVFYQRGTEQLIKQLLIKLGTLRLLPELEADFSFTRKIRFPRRRIWRLANLRTFTIIMSLYGLMFVLLLVLFVINLGNYVGCWNLPQF